MTVSMAKTTLLNVKWRKIKDMMGVQVEDDFGKYLGVPLLNKRVCKTTYSYILDQMKSKISNWNASPLSLAGRITLALGVRRHVVVCYADI